MDRCDNCGLPVGGEGPPPLLLPDGWGWNTDDERGKPVTVVCPTCVALGVPVTEVAAAGVN